MAGHCPYAAWQMSRIYVAAEDMHHGPAVHWLLNLRTWSRILSLFAIVAHARLQQPWFAVSIYLDKTIILSPALQKAEVFLHPLAVRSCTAWLS